MPSKRNRVQTIARSGAEGKAWRGAAGDLWPSRTNTAKIKKFLSSFPACGAIAQLGERLVRNEEAVGSSPTSSTKILLLCKTFPVDGLS